MIVVGIETTCDETAIAVTDQNGLIIAEELKSQIETHQKFGGVVPELASREHSNNILQIFHSVLLKANICANDIGAVAVSYGPGMMGSLLVGLHAAKTISSVLNVPIIYVNHLEAHLYASFMCNNGKINTPCIGAILSGGHTDFLIIESLFSYKKIGQTFDDAIGESFDKVAIMLGEKYPGGPAIEKMASLGNDDVFKFKVGRIDKYSISFSGIKTSVMNRINKLKEIDDISYQTKCDIALAFQSACFNTVSEVLKDISKDFGLSTLVIGGGVVSNDSLLKSVKSLLPHCDIFYPNKSMCVDNASMVAGLGYTMLMNGIKHDLLQEPKTNLHFS